MYGRKLDRHEMALRHFVLADYEGLVPHWCPGCGDHAVLAAVQRLVRDEQLAPENVVVVSGIGCSSRLPHYIKTYGFHGLHGRALPVACGVRSRRPDLHVFVATGDGDCCAIGAGHWIHALRYNMKMTVMMFDNNTLGLTEMQTSPTTRLGNASKVHPRGAPLSPLDPLSIALAVTNVSFVAQTVDWSPRHVGQTLRAAYRHEGLGFVRVLQRCAHSTQQSSYELEHDASKLLLLQHRDGLPADALLASSCENRLEHDPSDLSAAREIASRTDLVPIGILYRNENAERYDQISQRGSELGREQRMLAIQREIDRFIV